MRRLQTLVALLALVAVAAVPAIATTPSADAPVAAASLVEDPDPNRVFQEPLLSADYVQYTPDKVTGKSQYLDGLAELERRYADVIDITPIGDLVGAPELRSVGGRDIPVVEITDESVPNDDKIDLYFSMSIHGLERAGLEGGVRFIEDIAKAFYDERDGGAEYILSNGDPGTDFYREMTATEVLRVARLVFVNLNPDGWARGDRASTPSAGFKRGNDNNLDLNRQWPTLGWANDRGPQYETMSQPEAQAGRKLIEEYLDVPEGAADLHGEFGDDVLLAIMFPAGQFDPLQLQKQFQLASSIKHNVNNSVHPGAAGVLSSSPLPPVSDIKPQPAEFHTAFDAIGYDDAGFKGDYLVQQGILEMDHEYVFSNLVPNNVWIPELTQIHVDTTRELLKATIVTTIQEHEIDYTADLGGTVGYVENPEVLRHTDPGVPDPPFNFEQQPYESTSMQYYRDLAEYAGEQAALVPLTSDVVAGGTSEAEPEPEPVLAPGRSDGKGNGKGKNSGKGNAKPSDDATDDQSSGQALTLADLDTLVITDRDVPRYVDADGNLVAPDRAAFWGAVRDFAEGGGNVVLTDRAVQGVVDLGLVPEGSVTGLKQYAGQITEIDREHPLLAGVNGIVGQTYFEVPLGYPVSGGNHAPAWGVDEEAWDAAGGTIAGYLGSESQDGLLASAKVEIPGTGQAVGLGTAPLGEGQVTIFGAILPDASQAHPHTQGLADYAVTYGGNAIMVNALRAPAN